MSRTIVNKVTTWIDVSIKDRSGAEIQTASFTTLENSAPILPSVGNEWTVGINGLGDFKVVVEKIKMKTVFPIPNNPNQDDQIITIIEIEATLTK